MNPVLQIELLARSYELKLDWCSFHPIQMKNFVYKKWILVVDDSSPGQRLLWAFPPKRGNISKLLKKKRKKKN